MRTAEGSPNGDPAVATLDPDPDAGVCDECEHTEGLVTVDPDDPDRPRRTVCSIHLVEYLEVLR